MMITNQGIRAGESVVPWSDVVEVALRTTADGPFVEDVFWIFGLRDGLIEVPGSPVSGASLGVMQERLPGFDSLKVIAAMGSTSERIYQLWHIDHAGSVWNDATHGARFAALVERLGGHAAPAVFERLRAAWGAIERRYHDLEHLADCLRELDRIDAPRPLADLVELALWYHDAVYVPTAADNEERSAALLLADAQELGIDGGAAEAAAACVRATGRHEAQEPGSAAELVNDIDLAILGREPMRFMDFEYAIAEEYATVPWTRFVLGRGRFLAGVLRREAIFRTPLLRERYEATARRNISALLRSRRYRSHRLLGGAYDLLARAL